ncbi:hypothetical protein [Tunturiibacter gelidiferens]|uniref:hypothetical protein n=1 Tax=Tunturiibacter gelidiferens TaxID=3069689 RepID=UPI003D9B7B8A
MNEDDLLFAVRRVRESLAKSNLTWILREIDETLRLGKPAVRTVIEVQEDAPDLIHMRVLTSAGEEKKAARRKTTVPTTESYSAQEELNLLLDAIERTIISSSDMQSYVMSNLADRDSKHPYRGILFERDGEISSELPYGNRESALVEVDSLRQAIGSLRERAR